MKKCIVDFQLLQESVEYAAYDGGATTKDVQELIHKELTPEQVVIAILGEGHLNILKQISPAKFKAFAEANIDHASPEDQEIWGRPLIALYIWVGDFCGY